MPTSTRTGSAPPVEDELDDVELLELEEDPPLELLEDDEPLEVDELLVVELELLPEVAPPAELPPELLQAVTEKIASIKTQVLSIG